MELGGKLIEAEQRLAELPELERRIAAAEAENERLRTDLGQLERSLAEVLHSASWRLTAPLRRLRTLGRRG